MNLTVVYRGRWAREEKGVNFVQKYGYVKVPKYVK